MTNFLPDLRLATWRKPVFVTLSLTIVFFLSLGLKSRLVDLFSLLGSAPLLNNVAAEQLNLLFFSLLTALDLGLVVVSVFGVFAYSVAPRTQELGWWMARGARTLDVVKLVVRQGLYLALIGTVIGLATAVLLTGWLKVLRVGNAVTEPLTFIGVTLSLSTVAFFVYYWPARRATSLKLVTVRPK